jgi:hypothetical protein
MNTAFEIGAIFRIVNEASPALRAILKQVRELNAAIDKAKESLALIGKNPAVGTAIAETGDLAKAWGDVAKNAKAAQLAIGQASSASARAALPPAALSGRAGGGAGAGGAGAGGGRHRPGWLGGGTGAHVSGPGVPIPGGSHMRFNGGAAAAAGLVGYGAYEAAQMEDAVFQLIYHSGSAPTDENRAKFRKILQDSMVESGYGLHDISESAKQEIRMFQGTKGGGIDVLPEMLRAATIESRLKGESPEESMKALIGLAHMTKQYSPEAIKKLAPAFAFLSTANPGSLGSIERAAGYAVPLLQSGLEIDPMQSLLLGTALTRAGATSTKSGTWLREMALRAMPGTSMMSKMAFKKHEEALKAFGLVDDAGKPTWFDDKGKPDLFKMLDIAGSRANSIPLDKRAAYERSLFGAQGGGGFALLADPAVREQVTALRKEMESPEFKNRYAGFAQAYTEGSTVQNARTALQEFNATMMDLGRDVLPPINGLLKDFKKTMEGLRDVIPGASAKDSLTGTRALEGALGGAAVGGLYAGIPGAVVGGVTGGTLGVASAYLEQQAAQNKAKWEAEEKQRSKANLDAVRGQSGGPGGVFPGGTSRAVVPPIHLNLNIDGRALAAAVSEQQNQQSTYSTDTPASNGTSYDGP